MGVNIWEAADCVVTDDAHQPGNVCQAASSEGRSTMSESALFVIVAAMVRVLCWAGNEWLSLARERELRRRIVDFLAAAGPGASVIERHSDRTIMICAAPVNGQSPAGEPQ
jgi:hypothetical protein